jgi:hypothetical protein
VGHLLAISTPPVYELVGYESEGMVCLEPSIEFFGFNRKLELALDALNLHKLRINWMVKGLRKAANEAKILHVTAHPWNFQTPKDMDKLRCLLDQVANQASKGRMTSIGMAELAQKLMKQPSGAADSGGDVYV